MWQDRQARKPQLPYNATLIDQGFQSLKRLDLNFIFSAGFLRFCTELGGPWAKDTLGQLENKELKAIVVLMIILVLTFIQFVRKTVRLIYPSKL